MKCEKALVLGGDGLLGSHLVRELFRRGYSVRVYIQPNRKTPTLQDVSVERVEGDLSDDGRNLLDAVEGCKYVFHCAAVTDLWADPKLVWNVNYEGTRKVLDACVETGIRRLVMVGSASTYQFGPMHAPGDERGAFPKEYRGIPYMESKRRAIELVKEYVEQKALDAVVVAPTFMLGDLDAGPSSGELIRQFIKRGLRVTSRGGRNFAYAPDVAAAMVSAIDKGKRGECYIAGGRNLSYLDFFREVARIAGVKPPICAVPNSAVLASGAIGSVGGRITGKRVSLNLRMAKLSVLETYYRADKAIDELAMPQTPIETGIEHSIRSLKSFGHI